MKSLAIALSFAVALAVTAPVQTASIDHHVSGSRDF